MNQYGLTMTRTTQQILAVLVGRPMLDRHAAEICSDTGLRGGPIYPVLARLEALQWVDTYWENLVGHQQDWPRQGWPSLAAGAVDDPGHRFRSRS
jgi:hypothetical protein